MMTGYIRHATGLRLGVNSAGRALKQVNPQQRRERQTPTQSHGILCWIFGHKLHLDENEKLVQYGVTVVIAGFRITVPIWKHGKVWFGNAIKVLIAYLAVFPAQKHDRSWLDDSPRAIRDLTTSLVRRSHGPIQQGAMPTQNIQTRFKNRAKTVNNQAVWHSNRQV